VITQNADGIVEALLKSRRLQRTMLTVRSRLAIKAGILKNKTKTQDVKMQTLRSRIKNLTMLTVRK